AEKGWSPNAEIGKLPDLNRTDISGNTLGYRGIDRVFCDIAPGSEIVIVAFFLSQPPELFLHLVCSLPCTNYHLANAAHGLAIRRHDRDCAQVMQNVLGRYCFLSDTALGECNILRNSSVQVMGDHDHVERFFGRIDRVGPRRSCGSWEDICLTAHFD